MLGAGSIYDGVCAYNALHYVGKQNFGDTVLIVDGALSWRPFAIQLAQHWGARVSLLYIVNSFMIDNTL